MNKTVRWTAALAALALVLMPVACGGDGDTQSDVDREMDLALAQTDSATLADLQKKIDEEMAEKEAPARTSAPANAPSQPNERVWTISGSRTTSPFRPTTPRARAGAIWTH